ncbi:MAG TPA: DUF695 domain-containing protein, partial [Helicobacteraceae bacterium]|nr:DUF695 domain-containing protein [Helicobacteraceae bacterium]
WCYDDECLTLFSVSDSLNATLQKPCQAEPVGIKIHEGWFELYYYLESAKGFENSVKTILREAGYVSFEVGSAKDTKWSHYYQDLLPNARQQIQMQNRETIEALQVEDDDLSIVRDVEHYCFFQTQTQMLRFSDRMQSLGFLFKESVQEEHSEYPYGVVLIKEHDVEFDTVEAMSDTLFKALKEDHGTYLGWSTVLGANR